MVAGGGGEGEGGRAIGETTGRAGVAVGGRRREVKGEGDGGRARGDRDDGLADELAAGRQAEAGGGRRGRGRAVEREVETA